jgi:hypothetical protein
MSTTIVLECENIDSVLGREILKHKPLPFERLDYSVLQPWLLKRFSEPVKAIAVVREGDTEQRKRSAKFWGMLHGLRIQMVFAERFAALHNVCSPNVGEVVDHVVGYMLKQSTSDNIVYAGHDFYAADVLSKQRERGARVFTAAFPEYVSSAVLGVVEDVFDLERDMGAFRLPLPRLDYPT